MGTAFVRWIRKNRTWLFALSVIVVICTTYALISPAMTLDQEEAAQQGGIDITAEEQADGAEDPGETADPSGDWPAFAKAGEAEDPKAGLDFARDAFSMEEKTVTADGKNYEVSVNYKADAGVPAGAGLAVTEIEESDQAYRDYVARSEEALGLAEGTASYVRLFDIKILDEDNNKVDIAAPVDVKIQLADELADGDQRENTSVVHFADGSADGAQVESSIICEEYTGTFPISIIERLRILLTML